MKKFEWVLWESSDIRKTMLIARRLVAQAWERQETRHLEVDEDLVNRFAQIVELHLTINDDGHVDSMITGFKPAWASRFVHGAILHVAGIRGCMVDALSIDTSIIEAFTDILVNLETKVKQVVQTSPEPTTL